MQILSNENIVCFDVDDTLVMWGTPGNPPGPEDKLVTFNCFGYTERLLPHEAHIHLLKQFKVRGQFVVVWSQGGYQWANEVVKHLGLEGYVDLVMTKPKWIVDDLPPGVWMNRSYLTLDGKRVDCKDIKDVDFDDTFESLSAKHSKE